MPALLFVVMSSASRAIFRLPALGFLAWGFYVILASGSRGALVSLLVMGAFYLFFAPGRAKIVLVPALVPVTWNSEIS